MLAGSAIEPVAQDERDDAIKNVTNFNHHTHSLIASPLAMNHL
jgi:hypothetical protein